MNINQDILGPLSTVFKELFINFILNNNVYYVKNFYNTIKQIDKSFENIQNLQPGYFINFLLNQLHKELNERKNNKNNNINSKFQNKVEEYYYNFHTNNKSIISDNFFGHEYSKFICQNYNCKNISIKPDNFVLLNFNFGDIKSINNKFKLLNFFNFYYKNDVINKLECFICKSYSNQITSKKIIDCPKILTINLNYNNLQKDFEFNYELQLDISEYIQSDIHLNIMHFVKYELIGLVSTDEDMKYLSFFKSEDQWFKYDNIVSPCEQNKVLYNEYKPCILFYKNA